MAHFAKISDDGTVLEVIVVGNDDLLDADGVEQEQLGKDFCQNLFGGTWVQTSITKTLENDTSIGGKYDLTNNVFFFRNLTLVGL